MMGENTREASWRVGRVDVARSVVRIPGQMKSVAVTEFKAHCLALLEDVARTGEPLLVTKRGKALARVVPSAGEGAVYPQASLEGTVTIHGDIVGPVLPASAWNAVRGEPAIAREIVALATTRDWDPADRVLVATARVHGVPLVTSDTRIIDSKLVKTVD
jgi:prevent-host-death family protein